MRAKKRDRGREREREREAGAGEVAAVLDDLGTSVAMAGPSNMEEGRHGGRCGGEEQTKEKVVG